MISPKNMIVTPRIESKSKTKAIEALTKHSQKLIEKVKSLSPRGKKSSELPLNNSRRNDSTKAKSKSKKDSSFEHWKS
jgi:hypothetical protein